MRCACFLQVNELQRRQRKEHEKEVKRREKLQEKEKAERAAQAKLKMEEEAYQLQVRQDLWWWSGVQQRAAQGHLLGSGTGDSIAAVANLDSCGGAGVIDRPRPCSMPVPGRAWSNTKVSMML